VTISDFDPAKYTFDETSRAVSVAVGESGNVSFMGTPTRLPGQIDYIVRIENVSPAYEFSSSGHFAVPVGAAGPGPLLPGGTYEFLFHAGPGLHLSFATKFVQSNDFFYAPEGRGIAVWDDGGPSATTTAMRQRRRRRCGRPCRRRPTTSYRATSASS